MAAPRLLRKSFEPVLGIGDVCMLLGSSGFKSEGAGQGGDYAPFYEVTMVEAVPLLGTHGAIVIWSQSAPPPAPYVLDPQGATGAIAAGAVTSVTPRALVLNRKQLLQVRTVVKPIGTVIGALDDYDFTIAEPASVARWSLPNASGVLNAMQQAQQPSDIIGLPAQGANMTLPAAFPQADPFEEAWRTELWTYEDQGPAFSIKNNGSAATSGTFAFALQISGFLYNLTPVPNNAGGQTATKLGYSVPVPPGINIADVPIIPISGRQPY